MFVIVGVLTLLLLLCYDFISVCVIIVDVIGYI